MVLRSRYSRRITAALAVSVALAATAAWADITPTGDVSPAGPSTWDTWTDGYIGNTSTGTLLVNNGSTLLASDGFLGYADGATGMVTVDGTGSTWTARLGLDVGYAGTGSLTITNGGFVSSYVGNLGIRVGSTGTVVVDGAGSTWTSSIELCVGGSGAGSLTITNGGQVSNARGYIGFAGTGTGTATIDGTGSTWTNSDCLYVGLGGTGTLNITNGAIVAVAGTTYVAHQYSGSMGSINFGSNGGTLTTQSLHAAPAQFSGTGTINTRGVISEGDLAFDATHGLNQTLSWVSAQQNITVHLDMSGGSGTVGDVGAGFQGTGNLMIRDGMAVTSGNGYLGYKSGSAGTATVDGTGSTWTNNNSLFVGNSGAGTLAITNGGLVTVGWGTYVGWDGTATGSIAFGSNGGTLTTQSLFAAAAQFSGTGTVFTRGVVTDGNLVFDATQGLNQTLSWASAERNVSVHLDLTGGSGAVGDLGAGYQGTGTLTIRDGVAVTSGNGYLGFKNGSTGTATVDGTGSTWTNDWGLIVGQSGTGTLAIINGGQVSGSWCLLGAQTGGMGTVTVDGTDSAWTAYSLDVGNQSTGVLNITNGGQVSSTYCNVGDFMGSTGTVTVDGPGSTWSNSDILYLGLNGTGTLKITNGGTVTAASASISNSSFAVVDVGDNSGLSAGAGTLTNSGLIRLRTVAGLSAGTYTPVTAASWAGSGTLQALGGSWNSATHVITVTAPAVGDTSAPVTFNRATTQRVAITDGGTGASLWAGVQAASGSATVGGTLIGMPQVSALQSLLPQGGAVLRGWTVTGTGFSADEAVGLSVGIGAGYLTQGLAVWRWDGSAWSSFAATDLSSDGAYADFTVTSLGGYAVTTVPVGCSWNGASGNWSEAAKWYPRVPVNGAPVGSSYGAVLSGGVVTLDADAHVNTLQITGGTLAGAHNLTVAYGGTVTGSYNVTGLTTLTTGTLTLGGGSHSMGGVSGGGVLAVDGGTTLTADGVNLPLGSLNVVGNLVIRSSATAAYTKYVTGLGSDILSGTSKVAVSGLTVTGNLDIKNNALILDATDDAGRQAMMATLATTLLGGRITSSSAASNAKYKLAILDNAVLGATSFGGLGVGPNSVIVTEALVGDANIDGSVNALDLVTWKANFNASSVYALNRGDLNADGLVNALDLISWKANFNANITTDLAPSDGAIGTLGTLSVPVDTGGGSSAVPEPASLAVLALGAVGLLKRKRKH